MPLLPPDTRLLLLAMGVPSPLDLGHSAGERLAIRVRHVGTGIPTIAPVEIVDDGLTTDQDLRSISGNTQVALLDRTMQVRPRARDHLASFRNGIAEALDGQWCGALGTNHDSLLPRRSERTRLPALAEHPSRRLPKNRLSSRSGGIGQVRGSDGSLRRMPLSDLGSCGDLGPPTTKPGVNLAPDESEMMTGILRTAGILSLDEFGEA